MSRRSVLVLGLTLASCSHPTPIGNPPAPNPPAPTPPVGNPPAPVGNPPAPIPPGPPPTNPPATIPEVGLPAWDDVPNPAPPGATNPPRPVLVVSPDGHRCWKQWASPMMRPPPTDRVEACTEDCGTEVSCPDRARDLLR